MDKNEVLKTLNRIMELELAGVVRYTHYALLDLVRDQDVRLEDYARDMTAEEEAHADDVNKMLRKPGDTAAFAP